MHQQKGSPAKPSAISEDRPRWHGPPDSDLMVLSSIGPHASGRLFMTQGIVIHLPLVLSFGVIPSSFSNYCM